jgi:hypothetical protein
LCLNFLNWICLCLIVWNRITDCWIWHCKQEQVLFVGWPLNHWKTENSHWNRMFGCLVLLVCVWEIEWNHAHSFIHSFIHSEIHSEIHSFIHSFWNSFWNSFILKFILKFIHSFILKFIHSF